MFWLGGQGPDYLYCILIPWLVKQRADKLSHPYLQVVVLGTSGHTVNVIGSFMWNLWSDCTGTSSECQVTTKGTSRFKSRNANKDFRFLILQIMSCYGTRDVNSCINAVLKFGIRHENATHHVALEGLSGGITNLCF
jgi:hypothetical protein